MYRVTINLCKSAGVASLTDWEAVPGEQFPGRPKLEAAANAAPVVTARLGHDHNGLLGLAVRENRYKRCAHRTTNQQQSEHTFNVRIHSALPLPVTNCHDHITLVSICQYSNIKGGYIHLFIA